MKRAVGIFARLAALVRLKHRMYDELLRLRKKLQLKDDECILLREQLDGYRDAFLAIQTERNLRGAEAKRIIEAMREPEQSSP